MSDHLGAHGDDSKMAFEQAFPVDLQTTEHSS